MSKWNVMLQATVSKTKIEHLQYTQCIKRICSVLITNVVKKQNRCLFWELNPGPTDLQSDALPSELNRHTETYMYTCPRPAYESNSNIFSTPNTKKCIYHLSLQIKDNEQNHISEDRAIKSTMFSWLH
ncbi:Hypothetical_protein [Hexamita inflata]|uniref:Hypothetical_protein n=1 Tax=Hexamita inflata TaxID=28002 RepID=A0AA86RIH7_9EUKA|nr:Hypothetical protein HINF_LOCUS64827 [Hexamita inflata]